MRAIDVRTDHRQRHLEWAATLFTVAVLVHNSDHVRRGAGTLHGDVFIAGTLAMVLEVGVVAMVFARHRTAPLAATAVGFSLAAGYVVVHFTPDRSWLSDSLLSSSMLVSIGAAAMETTAALVLGAIGVQMIRERGLATMTTGRRPLIDGDALRHPVVVAMAAGNAVLLVASLLQYFH